MGSLSNESFDQFLDSLKQAGVEISNESNCVSGWPRRSAGVLLSLLWRPMVDRWEFAFRTGPAGSTRQTFTVTFARFQLPESLQNSFAVSLRA
jgi:hypothetical protein